MSEVEWNGCIHFEGNANAFRLLAHQFNGRRPGGFVLTYSTLASIVKYPYSSVYADQKNKNLVFEAERAVEKLHKNLVLSDNPTTLTDTPATRWYIWWKQPTISAIK